MKFVYSLYLLLVFCGSAAFADDTFKVFSSGDEKVRLIELYTSQGCSSCPPAERWLNNLEDNPKLWKDFVPLAFHVDYWDKLGWKDPYATRANTIRQYGYKSTGDLASVYTPAFVVDGKEWKGFFARTPLPERSIKKAGTLSVQLSGESAKVSFDKAGEYDLHVALLGTGIVTDVKRGENHGRKLPQDFVVLDYQVLAGFAKEQEVSLPSLIDHDAKQFALAAFISERGKLAPVQATGGWL